MHRLALESTQEFVDWASELHGKAGNMSIVAWVIFGLIPGFLAGALAEHYRQTARAKTGYSN
jgi:hypothetical protein